MADNTLAGWARRHTAIPKARQAPDGLLFAFYGRMSTEDYQDPVTSRQWQWANATELIAGKGTVVAEFFDIGLPGGCGGRAVLRPPLFLTR